MSVLSDQHWMELALSLADAAALRGEVPVGAVLIVDEVLVASAHNERESAADPTAHAELLALRRASAALGRWRIGGTLYVTLEPCAMCAGALVLARVDRLVYATPDPKAGAVRSLFQIADDPRLNHRVVVESGLLEARASEQLKAFFRARRG
ncbi:MAG: tRNA adenosine(34) deaminase TadA [Myxococcota bacterium]